MKVSLDWIGDYVELPADLDVARIARDLTMATVEVEGVEDLAARLAGIVVGRIVSAEQIPAGSAPRMRLDCDVGGRVVTVVAAYRNLAPGKLVAVSLSPQTGAGGERNDAQAPCGGKTGTERGEAAICTAAALGLESLLASNDHTEALDLSELECRPGEPLSAALGWNDFILEIDNKSLTNRPDLWGHLGLARELGAIYKRPLKPLPDRRAVPADDDLLGTVDVRGARRLAALRVRNVSNGSAPFWMRSRLVRIGQRSINLYADLTNYVMFALGQPTHAYDAERISLPLSARFARRGESIRLLDQKQYELDESVLTIADGKGSVAVAGVMGNAETSVSDRTKDVVIEVGTFDALRVRRASMRFNVRTEASSRFEKNIDTQRVDLALALLASLIGEIEPSARLAGCRDEMLQPTAEPTIEIEVAFLQERLGKALAGGEMAQILRRLGFAVTEGAGTLRVVVPSWRGTGDVSLKHDLVEEVARIYGYDNFEFTPPTVQLHRPVINRHMLLERRIKEHLALVGGFQEVVTYPWVKDRLLEAAGLAPALRLSTPPAPDQSALAPSLVPNLLDCIVTNLRYFNDFRIFQASRVFAAATSVSLGSPGEPLPEQRRHLAGALVGADANALYAEAKGLLNAMIRSAHIEALQFAEVGDASRAPWAEAPTVSSLKAAGADAVGSLGVLSARAKRLAGIRHADAVLFEIDIDALTPLPSRQNRYEPLAEYPEVDFDLSLIFPEQVPWRDIARQTATLHPLIRRVEFVDEYRGKGIPDGKKSITLRARLAAPGRTLRSEEIQEAGQVVARDLERLFGAELRG